MGKRGRPSKEETEDSSSDYQEGMESEDNSDGYSEDDSADQVVDEEAILEMKLKQVREEKEKKRLSQELPQRIMNLEKRFSSLLDNQIKMYDVMQKHHEKIQENSDKIQYLISISESSKK